MPKRPCRQTGCPKLHNNKHGFCDSHSLKATGWFEYAAKEERKGKRVYQTKEYKQIVSIVRSLAQELCQNCLRKGIVTSVAGKRQGNVEHIVPVTRGGTEDLTNLSLFCNSCATDKTAREKRMSVEAIQKEWGPTSVQK